MNEIIQTGNESGRPSHKRWIGAAILIGLVYFLAGITFATLANQAASQELRVMWRLAAWAVSGAAFAAHVGYENVRLRSSPWTTAFHVCLAVALGAFLLAVAAGVYAPAGSSHHQALRLALVIWPIITALPAFVVALAAAAILVRLRPPN